ncbi:MAG TPA: aldo/keto reductase [Actinomycetales bacterium]|nr:aldo/keto reductase [Actinomycetales bacterium]
MEQRYLGRSGLRVSRIGLGTMTWGRDTDEHEAADQLRSFVDVGGTLVDTAAGYADGASEELLGSLLGDVVPREDVAVCTAAGAAGAPGAEHVVDASRRTLLAALDTSLARLRTDHVDLWLAQAWDPYVPLEETLSALQAAVTSGRARYVGVANHRAWQLARTATLAERAGVQVVADQVEYSLVERSAEAELLPAAADVGAGVLGWSPLGRGVLTGKYRSGTPADSRAASPHFVDFVEPYLDGRCRRVVESVATAADGLGCAPVEVALAWARDAPGIAGIVLGARTAAQLRGALAGDDLVLPAEIRQALDDVSDARRGSNS